MTGFAVAVTTLASNDSYFDMRMCTECPKNPFVHMTSNHEICKRPERRIQRMCVGCCYNWQPEIAVYHRK